MRSGTFLTFLVVALSSALATVAMGQPTVAEHHTFLVQAWTQGMKKIFQATDRNNDGVISRSEVPAPQAGDLFRTYDLDRNKHISLTEWCGRRFQSQGADHLLSDAAAYFAWLDRNHDGLIDNAELSKLALYTSKGLMANPVVVRAQVFTLADLDNNHLLSHREFERFLGILFGKVVGWGRSSQTTP